MATAQETTSKTSSIEKQLRALVRLQHIDNRIDQIGELRGDLPDEIRDLEDEKAGLETRLENYEDEIKQLKVDKRQADIDIKEAEGLIKKYEEQQLQVRNNREYDALTKEIETQKERIEKAEQTIEEAEATITSHEEAIEETEERLGELDDALKIKQDKLDDVMADTQEQENRLEAIRSEAMDEVNDRYLRAYKRLRQRLRDGRAVVPLERGAAAGFAVPPQRQVEIRKRKRIIACEHTGRIIVDRDLYNDVIENMNV